MLRQRKSIGIYRAMHPLHFVNIVLRETCDPRASNSFSSCGGFGLIFGFCSFWPLVLGPVHSYPDIFEESFLSAFGLRSHREGVFGHRKRSFSKTLFRGDLFENVVFLLLCGRVKTELFENADSTASIFYVSEHVLGSLGITR